MEQFLRLMFNSSNSAYIIKKNEKEIGFACFPNYEIVDGSFDGLSFVKCDFGTAPAVRNSEADKIITVSEETEVQSDLDSFQINDVTLDNEDNQSSIAVDEHISMPSVGDQVKAFPCGKCSKSFATGRQVKRHLKEVHKVVKEAKKYVCEGCNKVFTVNSFNV